MKYSLIIVMSISFAFCSRVTTKPDRLDATSGTMGTVKSTDRPARVPSDTTRTVDTATLKGSRELNQ